MTMYARLSEQGLVLEVCQHEPKGCFHPDIAKEFTKVPTGAEPGDSVVDGKVVKQVTPEIAPPAPPEERRWAPRVDVMNTLTRAERVALTELAVDDIELKDFLAQLEINNHLDLSNLDDISLLERLRDQGVLSESSLAAIKAIR